MGQKEGEVTSLRLKKLHQSTASSTVLTGGQGILPPKRQKTTTCSLRVFYELLIKGAKMEC